MDYLFDDGEYWVLSDKQEPDREFAKYMWKKRRLINFKPMMKYYVPKDLYELMDFVVLYKPHFNLEIFTSNPDYKEIWSKLRRYEDYGDCRLLEMGYDDVYHCYCVDVVCKDLLRYLYSGHSYYTSPWSEKTWKSRALSIGWSLCEVNRGWIDYKAKCKRAFERRHGKHINLRR